TGPAPRSAQATTTSVAMRMPRVRQAACRPRPSYFQPLARTRREIFPRFAHRWRRRCNVAGRRVLPMDTTEEPFVRGELVTLREYGSPAEPLGRIVSVTPDGVQAEVAWHKHTGHANDVTVEPTVMLRRVHESEMDPAE